MKKRKRPLLCLVCACCLAMSGCVTIIEEEPAQKEQQTEQEENRQQEAQEKQKEQQTEQEKNRQQEVQKTEQPKQETQPSSVQANNAYGEKVYDAFVNAGYTIVDKQVVPLANGNVETAFDATVQNGNVKVFVTDCVSRKLAQKTFDANIAASKQNNMEIMEHGANGDLSVAVVRNNRANLNFVNAIDLSVPSTIYMEDSLPEQMEPMLQLLKSLGYPEVVQ